MEQSGVWPQERESHSTVAYQDRWMVLYGGFNEKASISNHLYILDTTLQVWEEYPVAALEIREGHSATLINDLIYFYGGQALHSDLIHNDMFTLRLVPNREYHPQKHQNLLATLASLQTKH